MSNVGKPFIKTIILILNSAITTEKINFNA